MALMLRFVYSINVDKRYTRIELSVPVVQIIGQYEMSGRILLLPIAGKGNINMTLGSYLNASQFLRS
jgi:hypothetical protein